MAFLYNQVNNVPQGQLTQTIYSLVRDQRFNDAVQLLEQQLQVGMVSTCGNSMLYSCAQQSCTTITYVGDPNVGDPKLFCVCAVCFRQQTWPLPASLLLLSFWSV